MKKTIIAVFVLVAAISARAQKADPADSVVIHNDIVKLEEQCECTAQRGASYLAVNPCIDVPISYIKKATGSKSDNIFDLYDEATPDQLFSAAKSYCRDRYKELNKKMAQWRKRAATAKK